jgi:DNA-binding NarL/FixJ family response regulator
VADKGASLKTRSAIFDLPIASAKLVVVSTPLSAERVIEKLTRAESDVARLAGEGLSNDAIAARRRTSTRTVANQLAMIFKKLSVTSRVHLAARLAVDSAASQRRPTSAKRR